MATDAVLSVVSEAQLGNKGLVVTVSQNGDILGHLMVGKASIVWFEKNAKFLGMISTSGSCKSPRLRLLDLKLRSAHLGTEAR